jgi:hypothetical protein
MGQEDIIQGGDRVIAPGHRQLDPPDAHRTMLALENVREDLKVQRRTSGLRTARADHRGALLTDVLRVFDECPATIDNLIRQAFTRRSLPSRTSVMT